MGVTHYINRHSTPTHSGNASLEAETDHLGQHQDQRDSGILDQEPFQIIGLFLWTRQVVHQTDTLPQARCLFPIKDISYLYVSSRRIIYFIATTAYCSNNKL